MPCTLINDDVCGMDRAEQTIPIIVLLPVFLDASIPYLMDEYKMTS